ncbi:MAG: Lrp/AsnC family transcriptional regulator [Nocardioidaceae bacterium]
MTAHGGVGGLDDLNRRVVAALQMDGRASWTSIAEACDTSVPTVARRAQQLLDEGIVRVAVMPEIGSSGPVDPYFLRITCRPGWQLSALDKLCRREDIRFLSLVSGGDDIVAELHAPRDGSLYRRLIHEILGIDGIERCRTDLILHVYKMAHDWSRQLLDGEQYVTPADEPQSCDPSHFDATDRAILDHLREDGRASFKSLAERLGINESTVRRRFEQMRTDGCVSVVTLVPAAALGFESETLLSVSVTPAKLQTVAHQLAGHRAVRYVAATLDGSTLMCEVIAQSTQELSGFVTHSLARLDGVLGWTAAIELMAVKRGFVETPWWQAENAPSAALLAGSAG